MDTNPIGAEGPSVGMADISTGYVAIMVLVGIMQITIILVA